MPGIKHTAMPRLSTLAKPRVPVPKSCVTTSSPTLRDPPPHAVEAKVNTRKTPFALGLTGRRLAPLDRSIIFLSVVPNLIRKLNTANVSRCAHRLLMIVRCYSLEI